MHTHSVYSTIYTDSLKLFIIVKYIVQTTSVHSDVWVGQGLHSVWNMLPTIWVYNVHSQLYILCFIYSLQCTDSLS